MKVKGLCFTFPSDNLHSIEVVYFESENMIVEKKKKKKCKQKETVVVKMGTKVLSAGKSMRDK